MSYSQEQLQAWARPGVVQYLIRDHGYSPQAAEYAINNGLMDSLLADVRRDADWDTVTGSTYTPEKGYEHLSYWKPRVPSAGSFADVTPSDAEASAMTDAPAMSAAVEKVTASARGAAAAASDPRLRNPELYNLRDKVQRSVNPYAVNPYASGGRLVSALTGTAELQQAQQRQNLQRHQVLSGLWGSGVAEGQAENQRTVQDLEDIGRDQRIDASRREWGAIGKDWERNKLQQLSDITATMAGRAIQGQNDRLTQAGFFANNQQFDAAAGLRKDKAAVAPYLGLGA